METTIYNFHTSFYIPAIYKLNFNIPHLQILSTNHCGESRRTAFKLHKSFQDMLRRSDYAERLVVSFSHQIKYEYYGGNRYVSIEGITLENFNSLPQTEINSPPKTFPRHAVFHSFLSDDRKQGSATTTVHI